MASTRNDSNEKDIAARALDKDADAQMDISSGIDIDAVNGQVDDGDVPQLIGYALFSNDLPYSSPTISDGVTVAASFVVYDEAGTESQNTNASVIGDFEEGKNYAVSDSDDGFGYVGVTLNRSRCTVDLRSTNEAQFSGSLRRSRLDAAHGRGMKKAHRGWTPVGKKPSRRRCRARAINVCKQCFRNIAFSI